MYSYLRYGRLMVAMASVALVEGHAMEENKVPVNNQITYIQQQGSGGSGGSGVWSKAKRLYWDGVMLASGIVADLKAISLSLGDEKLNLQNLVHTPPSGQGNNAILYTDALKEGELSTKTVFNTWWDKSSETIMNKLFPNFLQAVKAVKAAHGEKTPFYVPNFLSIVKAHFWNEFDKEVQERIKYGTLPEPSEENLMGTLSLLDWMKVMKYFIPGFFGNFRQNLYRIGFSDAMVDRVTKAYFPKPVRQGGMALINLLVKIYEKAFGDGIAYYA